MLFEVRVNEDGDIYVTKVYRKPLYPTLLYLSSYDELKKTLEDYGADRIEEDVREVERAEMVEEVRCW
ncbi:MAG: hypothetical protein ACLFTW_15670 [Chitinispirillaceae bacterium]